MSNAASELSDRVELLCFEELGEGGLPLSGAILDAMLEFIIETLQLGGGCLQRSRSLGDADFKFCIELFKLPCLR